MSDLLKEAIADAKAVRETALENAKMALEEAFTPQLKSMLSAKLKEEDLEEDEFSEGEHEDEDEVEEFGHDDEDEAEEGRHEEGEHEDEDEDEVDESEIIEIDGVKYAPIVAEEDDEDDEEAEEGMHEDDNLDLEAVIKELESELSEGEDDDDDDKEEGRGMKEEEESSDDTVEEEYEIDEEAITEKEDDDDDKDEVDEQSTSSGIGKGTGVKVATASDEEDPQGAKIVKAKMESVQAELGEYKEAVEYLKNKLHEVNLLNAKLLFTNKLFKEFTLDNSQKLKVVETFDRTQSTREIKLVYSTLAEQFSDNGSIKRKSIKESASSSVGSTKPSKQSSKVITEEEAVANRFKKLAGLING